MSIHNTTWDNSTEVSIGGSDQQSREPVPAGQYPCVIIRSSYDETARDVIYNQDKSVVRPVYDYREQKETPMTPDERGRGCFVAKSGTYLWLLLRVTLPNGDERLASVRPNIINVLRPPNEDRAAFDAVRSALGGGTVNLIVGQDISTMHERPFLAKLGLKEKRGSTGDKENYLKGALPLTESRPASTFTPPGAVGNVDVTSSADFNTQFGNEPPGIF